MGETDSCPAVLPHWEPEVMARHQKQQKSPTRILLHLITHSLAGRQAAEKELRSAAATDRMKLICRITVPETVTII